MLHISSICHNILSICHNISSICHNIHIVHSQPGCLGSVPALNFACILLLALYRMHFTVILAEFDAWDCRAAAFMLVFLRQLWPLYLTCVTVFCQGCLQAYDMMCLSFRRRSDVRICSRIAVKRALICPNDQHWFSMIDDASCAPALHAFYCCVGGFQLDSTICRLTCKLADTVELRKGCAYVGFTKSKL